MRVCTLFSHLTSRSRRASVWMTASRKYVIIPIRLVFHLFAILVKVVEPEAIRIVRHLFSNCFWASLSTLRKACAVISLVASFCSFHTPSRCVNSSWKVRIFGRMRTSKPHMLNRTFGLSFEYTDAKELSQTRFVTLRGSLFCISQNTALPRFTSCFMRRMRQSRGQHILLLYPTTFSLLGSGFSVRNLWMRSRDSSLLNRNTMMKRSRYRQYRRIGCRNSVSTSWNVKNSLGSWGGPANSEARVRPSCSKSRTRQ
mmetsp:Transcript_83297/g.257493  ORF Transcript_83297/g.257493 Transcript_83297/m.257493 type:complete len:256 (+) Transcript_83297:2353-3120(+)